MRVSLLFVFIAFNAFAIEQAKPKLELDPKASFDDNIKLLCVHAKQGQNECKQSLKCDDKDIEKNNRFLREFCDDKSKGK